MTLKTRLDENVKLYMETKNERYFKYIYDDLNKPLLSFIKKTIKDNDSAYEVLSNTFERLFIALRDKKYAIQENTQFRTYAHSCATNAVRYYLRYHNRVKCFQYMQVQDSNSKEMNSFTTNVFDSLEGIDNIEEIAEIHNYNEVKYKELVNFIHERLPEKDHLRTIGKMFYIENKDVKSIGNELGYSKSNVKYRLMRIRDVIRNNVEY